MNALMEQAKKPINVAKEYDINETAERLVFEWGVELGKHGQTAKPHENTFAYNTFKLWQQQGVLELPVIVGAQPGFGKSTMISVYLRYMVREYPDTFGAIIVKERIEDMERLANEINGDEVESLLFRQNNYAYYIRGYDEKEMTREHYEEQFTAQAQYNVVIMTTKQFELQALKDNLGAFGRFKDSRGSNKPRRLLLIDEKPSLVVSNRLNYEQLNVLKSQILQASHEATGRRQPYVNRTIDTINALSKIIEETEHIGRFKLGAVKPGYLLPRKLLANFGEVFGVDELQILRSFERVIGYGGELSSFNGRIEIVSTYFLHYDFTEYNAFVLDGTGDIDPEYIGRDFNLFMPDSKPDYSNVTFHVCNQYSMSKTSIKSNVDALENIAEECKLILSKTKNKTLIVTNKEFIPGLENLLKGYDNAVFKHYDGGRGTNEHAEIDNAIYIGVLHKGAPYYSTAAQAVIGDREGKELDFEQHKVAGRYVFKNEQVEEYKSLDMAVSMIQETNRMRPNKKENDVNIYVFYNDERTISHIMDAYAGAELEGYTTINKLVGKRTTADLIIEYFDDMEPGEVKGSQIYKSLGVEGSTFRKAVEQERVQQAMKKYGIHKVKTRYVKQ